MSPLHPLLGILKTSPNAPLHAYSSRSEIVETSEKGCWKEKEKQRCLKYERANVNVSSVASASPSQRRRETPQKTSDYLGNLHIDETNMDGAPEATLNEFCASGKSMPYTLLSLRNWVSKSGQLRKIPWKDIPGG